MLGYLCAYIGGFFCVQNPFHQLVARCVGRKPTGSVRLTGVLTRISPPFSFRTESGGSSGAFTMKTQPQGNTAQISTNPLDTISFIRNKICFISCALVDMNEETGAMGNNLCSGLQQIFDDIELQLNGLIATLSKGGVA